MKWFTLGIKSFRGRRSNRPINIGFASRYRLEGAFDFVPLAWLGFYSRHRLCAALARGGTAKSVRRSARKHQVRLRRIMHREFTEKGLECGIGAFVPRRCVEGLRSWFDESVGLLQAAEAALPSDQLAIYKGSDSAAKLAQDYELLETGAVPTGILHRYKYVETPLQDLCWALLKALGLLLLIPMGIVLLIL